MSLDYSVLRPNDGATGMGGFGVHGRNGVSEFAYLVGGWNMAFIFKR
jgi:hypothetical protein